MCVLCRAARHSFWYKCHAPLDPDRVLKEMARPGVWTKGMFLRMDRANASRARRPCHLVSGKCSTLSGEARTHAAVTKSSWHAVTMQTCGLDSEQEQLQLAPEACIRQGQVEDLQQRDILQNILCSPRQTGKVHQGLARMHLDQGLALGRRL